ncbi:MAG TPA: GNAT family N-acetyltransferase [Vicinamibacterales bacterium]|jgi:orotate phosphoribosyltransferase
MIQVRPVRPEDEPAWLRMRHDLWPDASGSHAGEIARFLAGRSTSPREVLMAFDEAGTALGFAELSIRPYVDGCDTNHVAYLEGWYVVPDRRRAGIGRALVAAAEDWGRAQGSTEFGSDTLIDNDVSAAAHLALGFEPTETLRYFRKPLDRPPRMVEQVEPTVHSLLDLVAARRGHFRYESGYHGALWLDLDALFADPVRIDPFVAVLSAALRPYDIDAICGAMVGGAFLAQLLARSLGAEFCFTEMGPPSGQGLYRARYQLPAAFVPRVACKRVAIVDDVMSAGSALRGTYSALQAHGTAPVVAGALLVLGTTGASFFADHAVPVVAALRDDCEIWSPEECPLCASSVPLEGK